MAKVDVFKDCLVVDGQGTVRVDGFYVTHWEQGAVNALAESASSQGRGDIVKAIEENLMPYCAAQIAALMSCVSNPEASIGVGLNRDRLYMHVEDSSGSERLIVVA